MVEIKDIAKKMVDVRHHLHSNPELSFREYNTCAYIKEILDKHSIRYYPVAGTGVLAVIEGDGDNSNHGDILIRADIDALPIKEESDCAFKSQNDAMHACGHDIHTSVLLGVLIYLSSHKNSFSGRVIGLFEPGEEESPGGASMVIQEKILEKYDIKAALALHTAHDMEIGKFGIREGVYMASTSEMRITVEGIGGHAALPNSVVTPILPSASLISELNKIEKEYSTDKSPVIIAIGRIIADGTTNIIPSKVTMAGTIRAMSLKAKDEIKSKISNIAQNVAFDSRTKISVEFTDGYPPVRNDIMLSDKAKEIFIDSYGSDNIVKLGMRMTADDFGFFSESYPSLYYRLGVKKNGESSYAPHTSMFVADDDSIYFGIDSMLKLVKHIL